MPGRAEAERRVASLEAAGTAGGLSVVGVEGLLAVPWEARALSE